MPIYSYEVRKVTRTQLIGALVWGIGSPFLLASWNSWKYGIGNFIGSFIFFLILSGVFSALIGMALGYFIRRLMQRKVKIGYILLSASGLGVGLNVFNEWASIGLLYSFGAIADHLSIPDWSKAFWPIFVALLPLAITSGVVCAIVTAFIIFAGSRMAECDDPG